MPGTLSEEVAVAAARMVVEDGMEYGPAKRRAARLLGRRVRDADLPDNERLEDEVRAYLALFCAETQPAELAALRALAKSWMERLAAFRPHLSGAVWRGTATRKSAIHIDLYCDDSKAAELALIDGRIDYDVSSRSGPHGELVDVLSVVGNCRDLGERVPVHLSVLDYDDLRGALKGDARGRAHRGDLAALRALEGSA
ncbi:MAG: hypothetical protein ABI809_04450 [Caldimonas sp.]